MMRNSPADAEFDAEIATLRDQLVEAVRSRRLASLEGGLALLEEVGEALLGRTAAIDGAMHGHARISPFRRQLRARSSGLGLVSEALWPVLEMSIRMSDYSAFWPVMQSMHSMLIMSWERGDLHSFNELSALFPRAALVLLRSQTDDLFPNVARLSKSLAGVWDSTVGTTKREASPEDLELSDIVIRRLLEVAKELIDSGNNDQLRRWAWEYHELFQYLDLPRFASSGLRPVLLAHKQAGYLAVRAWVLLCCREPWLELSAETGKALFKSLESASTPNMTWRAVIDSADDRLSDTFGLSWWEAMARPNSDGGYAVVFGGYLSDAILIELVEQPEALAYIPRPEVAGIDGSTGPNGDAARRLRQRLDQLDSYVPDFVDEATAARIDSARQRLTALIEASDRAQLSRVIQTPLEPQLVEAFRAAVVKTVLRDDRFSLLLPSCADDQETDEALFGINALVPKDYFINGEVYAEAADLGETHGRQLLVGETDLILGKLREACGASAVEPSEIVSEVRAAIDRLTAGYDPRIYISDVRAWDELRAAAVGRSLGVGYDDPFVFEGAEAHLMSATTSDLVLVADLNALACFRRRRIDSENTALMDDGRLLVDVAPVSAEMASEIAADRVAQSDSRSIDEELDRLMGLAHVRVLIRPALLVHDSAACEILTTSSRA